MERVEKVRHGPRLESFYTDYEHGPGGIAGYDGRLPMVKNDDPLFVYLDVKSSIPKLPRIVSVRDHVAFCIAWSNEISVWFMPGFSCLWSAVCGTPPYVNHVKRAVQDKQPGGPERPMIRAQALDRVLFALTFPAELWHSLHLYHT